MGFLGGVIILIIYINTWVIKKNFSFIASAISLIIFFLMVKNTFSKINYSNSIRILIYENINIFIIIFLIIYLLLVLKINHKIIFIFLKNNYIKHYELLFFNNYLNYYFFKSKFQLTYMNKLRIKYIKIFTCNIIKRKY